VHEHQQAINVASNLNLFMLILSCAVEAAS